MAVKITQSVLKRMNLPLDLWRVGLSGVQDPAVAELMTRWAKKSGRLLSEGKGFLFFGPTGTGKSALASMVARQARSLGMPVYFTTLWELRQNIWAKNSFDSETSVMQRARDVRVLILDDLTVEDAHERVLAWPEIQSLLRERIHGQRPTLLTTRLDTSKLDATFPGFLDLVVGSMVAIEVDGENLREKASQDLERELVG